MNKRDQFIADETTRIITALEKAFESEGLDFTKERYQATVNGVLGYLGNLTASLEELTNDQRLEFTLGLITDFVKRYQQYSNNYFEGIKIIGN